MEVYKRVIKRNDPCWCGSGKKYKKCHMQADQETNRKHPPPKNRYAKSPEEIAGMRRAGAFNGELLDYMRSFVKAGVSTGKLNALAHEYTVSHGHVPATLNYRGFPKSICSSINNVVCHGIPSETEILKDGDIINIDLTSIVHGFHGDSSETFMIGAVSPEAGHLVDVTVEALKRGIGAVRAGNHLREIANAIEPYVNSQACSVVRQYTGHGIGRKFHEHFSVYHHRADDCENVVLEPGMTLTIEPMINLGGYEVVTDTEDKWTVRTKDGSLSAQFEHTVLVTEHEPEILTLTPSEKAAGEIVILNVHNQ
ncbi:MAG: type I methionyl aminopeptidase [Chitinivibrionales bacterium]|nr:type I methionyl aminopeptidase [Chitinivibrionales bacterium]